MPYKSEKINIKNTNYDRRQKLDEENKQLMRKLREEEGFSYQALADMFGVSKRLAIFVCNPDIYERSKKMSAERNRSGRYDPTKEEWAKTMRDHRRYKQKLYKDGKIGSLDEFNEECDMKAEIYRNIDIVRIPIKAGVKEYNFPRFTDWADKKIDKLVFYAAINADSNHPVLDPITGITPVYGDVEQSGRDTYVNLVNKDGVDIANYLQIQEINSNLQYAGTVEVNDTLNLSLCRVKMTSAPSKDMTLIFYVFWGGKKVEDYAYPTRTVTIEFPMEANQELTFRELLNTYVHGINMPDAKIKGIIAWDEQSSPAWLTLRDHSRSYIINNLNTQLAHWSRINYDALIIGVPFVFEYPQLPPMLLDNIDIDFDYSRVRNALDIATNQRITFLY